MTKWLRLGFVLALCGSAGWAVDWKALQPQGYVSDFAGVISPEAKSQLEAYCTAVEQSTGAQIALVTIATLEGEPIEDVANTIFRTWGVGQKGKNEGILLLLATADRRSRLEVGYGLEPILPDGMDGRILRQMRPALRQGDFGDAFMAAAQTIGNTIAQAKHVQIQATLPRRYQPSTTDSIPWPMILGGILLLLWLLRAGGPRGYSGGGGGGFIPGLILGNVLGRSSWGSRGSGGFGGSDSGDGFGGFGGGDSGGGGASSDW
ncbi:MAG: TPM domain-containing protein [Candidatus Sulfopaludibacter sp.]|nr:TPM domain-containing protein [Candidatus Sulfopaludibacter sp.]